MTKSVRAASSRERSLPGIVTVCWRATIGCGLLVALFRIWCCICIFPAHEWNDVRLRPSFLIADGLPLYAGLNAGPITTWIYGPAMPLLLLPATFAQTIDSSLLVAAVWNALFQVGAIAFACLLWPQPAEQKWSLESRLGALAATTLLLAGSPFFVHLQADNASLACGLVSLTCLARAELEEGRLWRLAAFFGVAAAFSKLHGVAVIVGEIGWLWWSTRSPIKTGRFILLVAAAFVIWMGATRFVSSSATAAWEIMMIVPSRLPFTPQWSERLSSLAPYYGLMVAVPGIFALASLRRNPRTKSSRLGLPISAWLASLPLGIAGSLTTGGTLNSLHGAFFWIPIGLIQLFSGNLLALQRVRFGSREMGVLVLAALIAYQATGPVSQLPWKPQTSLPTEAVSHSSRLPDRLWIPWRPLATRFATGRHDHDEDGLYVRQLTGIMPRRAHLFAYLPPRWDSTLFQADTNSGVAATVRERGSRIKQLDRWVLLTRPSSSKNAPSLETTP